MKWVLDDEIDGWIVEARGTGSVDAQNEIYKKIQQKLADNQSDVYVLTQRSRQACSNVWTDFHGFQCKASNSTSIR